MNIFSMSDDAVINEAMRLVVNRMATPGEKFERPSEAIKWLQMKLGNLDHEESWVLFFDPLARLIGDPWMLSKGDLTSVAGYPREIAREALKRNAWGVVIAHNHITGDSADPSDNDKEVAVRTSAALSLIDVAMMGAYVITATDSHDVLRDVFQAIPEFQEGIESKIRRLLDIMHSRG